MQRAGWGFHEAQSAGTSFHLDPASTERTPGWGWSVATSGAKGGLNPRMVFLSASQREDPVPRAGGVLMSALTWPLGFPFARLDLHSSITTTSTHRSAWAKGFLARLEAAPGPPQAQGLSSGRGQNSSGTPRLTAASP